jgi:hypothetical protein
MPQIFDPVSSLFRGWATIAAGPFITRLNITSATVVKATAGAVVTATVVVAGSTPGTINDVATTGGAAAANQIASLPNTVGTISLSNSTAPWPCSTGIVVVPGTGQTVAIEYG